MKKKDLTPKQANSVPCPVCNAPAGKKCQLSAGGFRFESHVNRKLKAIEAIEGKSVYQQADRSTKRGSMTGGEYFVLRSDSFGPHGGQGV